jgi:hypothetical protein
MIRTLCLRAIVLALFLLGLGAIGRAQDLAITRATEDSQPSSGIGGPAQAPSWLPD